MMDMSKTAMSEGVFQRLRVQSYLVDVWSTQPFILTKSTGGEIHWYFEALRHVNPVHKNRLDSFNAAVI